MGNRETLNTIFGPSIFLLVLDLFVNNPDDLMNLREIARRVDKNPGSVSPIMPRLVERDMLIQTKIGKVSYVYQLNSNNEIIQLLFEFNNKLQELQS